MGRYVQSYHWSPHSRLLIHTQLFLSYLLQRDKLKKLSSYSLLWETWFLLLVAFCNSTGMGYNVPLGKLFCRSHSFVCFFQPDKNHFKFSWRCFSQLRWMQEFLCFLPNIETFTSRTARGFYVSFDYWEKFAKSLLFVHKLFYSESFSKQFVLRLMVIKPEVMVISVFVNGVKAKYQRSKSAGEYST